MRTSLLAATLVLLAPLTCAAQGGPMIVERVENGFLAAPDVKVTDVDHRTSELVGGYAGWVFDQTVFVGGGGYWMANGSNDRELGYGGLVLQWFGRSNNRFGWGLKGLIGGGTGTLTDTITEQVPIATPPLIVNGRAVFPPTTFRTITAQIRTHDDFFVAEPEADVRIKLAKHARLTAGVGYRFAGAEHRDTNRLSGAVGSLGIQFGGGF